ncbi:MAG: hydrogenase 3 maturation endopeptidase HyCI [Gammaproteobacteria bacterium]|nr:hydrogenase 3 maturation endopeptidase HyCI [Gammaproteobacteria bacterium]
MGNRLWGDDGVGSRIAERLQQAGYPTAVDGGIAPENHLAAIADAQPETILIVDATDFGARAGAVRLMDPSNVDHTGVSTHAGSPLMLARYLEARTGAKILFLGIQPDSANAGEKLSPAVRQAANRLIQQLCNLM